mmetsp:Transcript_18268/g.24080  ORF Transcript_18268/g.24080 Transcript_18268/m.24080 type:complete len:588 (+) Transcript_18268:216-1979(+)
MGDQNKLQLLFSLFFCLIVFANTFQIGNHGFKQLFLHSTKNKKFQTDKQQNEFKIGNGRQITQMSWDLGKFDLGSFFNSVGKTEPKTNFPKESETDVAIIGGGPAGLVLAAVLAKRHKADVTVIDPNPERPWPNNYGVWIDEWEELERLLDLGLGECLGYSWSKTDCFYGGSHGMEINRRLRLDRAYGRVDRVAMKSKLVQVLQENGVKVLQSSVGPEGIDASNPKYTVVQAADGSQIKATAVVDCTGHDSKLIERDLKDGPHNPGYQIAYGIVLEVPDHSPYDDDAMVLMDYRSDFLPTDNPRHERLQKEPTFMYAMPLGKTKNGLKQIFVEETSLVARPMMSFDECKKRMYERFEYMGWDIQGYDYSDEEFCYIPMGGALPIRDQRVIAFGGAASIVHPATGYMVVRMMAAASQLANGIAVGVKEQLEKGEDFSADEVSQKAFDSIWFSKNTLERDFMVFGGEFLMKQDVTNLRGFFDAFFKLPQPVWAGFLSGWPTLPNNETVEDWLGRVKMGLELWVKAPISVKLALMAAGVFDGGWQMLRSVTPLGKIDVLPLEVPENPVVFEKLKDAILETKAEKATVLSS